MGMRHYQNVGRTTIDFFKWDQPSRSFVSIFIDTNTLYDVNQMVCAEFSDPRSNGL